MAEDSRFCSDCGASVGEPPTPEPAAEPEPDTTDTEPGGGLPARRLLIVGVLLAVAVASAAGAYVFVTEQQQASPLDQVPEDVDMVAHAEVGTMLSDAGIRRLVDTTLEAQSELPYYDGPSDFEEGLDQFEDEAGLDPSKVETVTAFSEYNNRGEGVSEYSGVIIQADWDEDDLIDAFEEEGTELDDTDYEGYTVYEPESDFVTTWVGVLSDGEYVIGTEDAVKDVIDVRRGEEDAVDGDLKSVYSDLRSGQAKFAFRVPTAQVPDEEIGQGAAAISTGPLRDVEYVSGVYYRDGDTVGSVTVLYAEDADAAMDVADVLDGSLSLVRGMTTEDDFKDALRDVEVEREDDTVVITAEKTVDSLEGLIQKFYERQFGGGGGGGGGGDGGSTPTATSDQ